MRLASGLMPLRVLVTRFSLRTNLALLIVLAVAVLAADRASEFTRMRADEVARASSETLDAARIGAERQADVLASLRAILRLAADSPVTATAGNTGCRGFQSIVAELPWLRGIWMVGIDGRPICGSSESTPKNESIADRQYFRDAVAARHLILSDYLVGRFTGKPGIVAAMPRIVDGKVELVVIAIIQLDWLSHIAAEIGSSHGTEVMLLDSALTVIAAYPDPKERVGHSLSDNDALAAVLRNPDGTGQSNVLGELRVISHVRLHDTAAVLAVMVPLESVIAKSDARALRQIGGIFLAGLAALLLVWIAGERLLMRPIRKLADEAALLGSGDLAIQSTTDGLAPELRRLGDFVQ